MLRLFKKSKLIIKATTVCSYCDLCCFKDNNYCSTCGWLLGKEFYCDKTACHICTKCYEKLNKKE